MDLAHYIRDIPDFPRPGILFKDITPLLAEPRAFRQAIQQMCEHYHGDQIDAVAAAEARGFLFAAPLALLDSAGTVERTSKLAACCNADRQAATAASNGDESGRRRRSDR